MPNPIAKLRQLSRRVSARGFLRDRSGAMAVEFALVAAPLLFMLFAIIELALVFMVSSSLENAVSETARTIRTGALQSGGTATATSFRNSVCAEIRWMQSTCQSNLYIDVRVFSQFNGQTAPNRLNPTTKAFDSSMLLFNMGGPGDIILVRAFYHWKLVSPYKWGGLDRVAGGKTQLTASATFKNEPY